MREIPIREIRGMGGKLGEQVLAALGQPEELTCGALLSKWQHRSDELAAVCGLPTATKLALEILHLTQPANKQSKYLACNHDIKATNKGDSNSNSGGHCY
eukprot:1370692-Amphidinium_carterae.1